MRGRPDATSDKFRDGLFRRVTSGLTLAEVVLATGLLTLVVVIVMGVFIGGLRLMSRSEQRTQATNLARLLLESINDQGGFHALPDTDTTFDGKVPDPAVNDFPPTPYPGNEHLVVTVKTRALSDRTRAVLVNVAWNSGAVQLEKVFHATE
jgi:Tfp pilus assembly protein PilV